VLYYVCVQQSTVDLPHTHTHISISVWVVPQHKCTLYAQCTFSFLGLMCQDVVVSFETIFTLRNWSWLQRKSCRDGTRWSPGRCLILCWTGDLLTQCEV